MASIRRFFRWLFSIRDPNRNEPIDFWMSAPPADADHVRRLRRWPRHVPCQFGCGRLVYVPRRLRGSLAKVTCAPCYHQRKAA